jgi:hypothetical protein
MCVAKNSAVLDGLLTVFHVERSADAAQMLNVQNTLPLLSDYDKEAITVRCCLLVRLFCLWFTAQGIKTRHHCTVRL